MLSCASMWRNHLLPAINRRGFVYLLEDIFPLRDHLGDFLLFWGPFFSSPVSSGLCFGALPWISIVFTFALLVDAWMLTKAKVERVKTPRLWNRLAQHLVLFFSLYGLLLERLWQGANILEDSVPSQSSSTTCTECCWLETSWFLELLEWVFRLTGVNLIPQEKLHLKVKLHRSQSSAAEA